jgi:hypothetical protein
MTKHKYTPLVNADPLKEARKIAKAHAHALALGGPHEADLAPWSVTIIFEEAEKLRGSKAPFLELQLQETG